MSSGITAFGIVHATCAAYAAATPRLRSFFSCSHTRRPAASAIAAHAHDSHRLRVGSVFHQLNFGLLTIDWRSP